MLDLLIAGARSIVGDVIDVGISGGKIALVSPSGTEPVEARQTIDASGLLILPGIIDPHTHLNYPFDEPATSPMSSETEAAAAGGVTTVGHYPLGARGNLLAHLVETQQAIEAAAHVDIAISYPILEEKHLEELDALYDQGVTSFKILRAYRPPDVYDFGGVDDALFYRALLKVGTMNQSGRQAFLKVHCENVDIFRVHKEAMQARFPDLGRDAPLEEVTWAHCRPPIVEAESVASALYLAQATGCPIMIVHLSSGMSLEPIREAKRRDVDVLIETTPLYLETDAYGTGTVSGPSWTRVQPSVKFPEDAEALWGAVGDGTVDLVGTDHAASRMEVYEGKSVWDHGASGRSLLALHLAIMLDAVHRGRMTLSRLVELMCEVPARVLNIDDRKGKLEVGFDGDVVLCDLTQAREVAVSDLHSRADHTCFEGRTLRGWPVTTMLRGEVIWNDGNLVTANTGRYTPGKGRG
jgi:dihydroorotase-like cyclic amidohydrolase